jgi:hypothetical protein
MNRGRFDECKTCVSFNTKNISANCFKCGAGEFYEERVREFMEVREGEAEQLFFGKGMPDDD